MLLSVGKGMRLYLYIAQVGFEWNTRVGSLFTYDMNGVGLTWYTRCLSKLLCMILTTFVMIMYDEKDNDYDFFISLLCLCGVMGLHIHIALVDLDWGYE